jgi:hypothetical protein
MSGEPNNEGGAYLKRVPAILRSWDGPNSRIGLEVDLDDMPWGPFDALGKRLSLILPSNVGSGASGGVPESEVARALRHVEHAAARCAEFAQLPTGNQEQWRRSQQTWEWIRAYLTALWVETDVGTGTAGRTELRRPDEKTLPEDQRDLPSLPGAAATLRVTARVLRSTPLAVWKEAVGSAEMGGPTREEAVQTLLGVSRVLDPGGTEGVPEPADDTMPRVPAEPEGGRPPELASPQPEEADPDQISFDFASGYDEGYRMGRRVGMALGSRKVNAKRATQG